MTQKPASQFVLVIFEILGSHQEVDACMLEAKENLYLQTYLPKTLLLNVLFWAYTPRGFKHSDQTKKTFSLNRRGHKGKKRPDITGALHPMYGKTGHQNPFFGKKHTLQNLLKISKAAQLKVGARHPRASAVYVQNLCSGQHYMFVTKTQAAKFVGMAKANTVTQYIEKKKCFQKTWVFFQKPLEEL